MPEEKDTEKMDNASKLSELYELARSAKEIFDKEKAQNYYRQILELEPNSREASFFYRYFRNLNNLEFASIKDIANDIKNALIDVFNEYGELVKQNKVLREEDYYDEYIEYYKRAAFAGHALAKTLMEQSKGNYTSSVFLLNYSACIALIAVSGYGLNFWGEKKSSLGVLIEALDMCNIDLNHFQTYRQSIVKYIQDNINPSYVPPEPPQISTPSQNNGCYVATAVYGSYDCPEVWILRRYRDYSLAKTWYGRLFIRTYYAISPSIVKWFGSKTWFKKMWKGKLDQMVKNLHNKGYESTPYVDIDWR